jgi:hypothetical protein
VCTSVVVGGGGDPPVGAVTVSVYVHEPVSPSASASVPETVYVFALRIPVVLTAPAVDTLSPVLATVVAYVTAVPLNVVGFNWSVNVVESLRVDVPESGAL